MPIAQGKTTKAFRSCENKGFHITFKNGWTVSVQWGAGNYCENHSVMFEDEFRLVNRLVKDNQGKEKLLWPEMESDTAEVLCWNKDGERYPEEPLAYQTPQQVLEVLNTISRK